VDSSDSTAEPKDAPNPPQVTPTASEPSVAIKPGDAAILLKGDLANIAKKVKGGKTLSKAERDLLQASVSGGLPSQQEYCDTQDELARLIGVTRKTIQRWRKVEGSPEPRADGRWHVPSWRQFKINRQGDDEDEEENPVASVARAKQILLQNERLEMRILAEKKELIPKVVSQQIFSKLIIAAKTRCFTSVTRFVTLARMAENSNKSAEEIRKEMILIWQELEKGEWLK
jgi:transcriptional regulator with XRE-family HTH domain